MTGRRGAAVALVLVAAGGLLMSGVAWAAGLVVTSGRLGTATLSAPPLHPTAVTVAPAKVPGAAPDTDDVVTVDFSEPLRAASVCPGVADSAAPQTLPDVVVRLVDGGAAHDTLVVTGGPAACPAPRFGTLDLGTPDYATGAIDFPGSTLTLTSPPRLTIRLGKVKRGPAAVSQPTVITYLPDPRLADRQGTLVGATTAATAPGQQF